VAVSGPILGEEEDAADFTIEPVDDKEFSPKSVFQKPGESAVIRSGDRKDPFRLVDGDDVFVFIQN
jgi:hypothetical protein